MCTYVCMACMHVCTCCAVSVHVCTCALCVCVFMLCVSMYVCACCMMWVYIHILSASGGTVGDPGHLKASACWGRGNEGCVSGGEPTNFGQEPHAQSPLLFRTSVERRAECLRGAQATVGRVLSTGYFENCP